jgi:hypothetical protein
MDGAGSRFRSVENHISLDCAQNAQNALPAKLTKNGWRLNLMTSETTIQTDNVPQDVLGWHDLTDAERAEFDYLDTDDRQLEAQFVRYRDATYDLGEFQWVGTGVNGQTGNGAFLDWHGFHTDSYFSAVLVKYVDPERQSVIMGSAFS